MKPEIKKAVCIAGKTATKNKLQCKPYLKAVPLSSLKIQVGKLLLNLHNQNVQQTQWKVFESKLKQYIDLKFSEVNL